MAGVYRPRHPEGTVLYRVLFHHFDRFLTEYESRFEREYGFFRPIVREVVEKYLDCGNPRSGFARIRCPDCAEERLVMFSCRTRGFCPSCHGKRIEEWGEWMREILLLDVPHRQVVFTIPKRLRVFFKFNRRLLGDLCRCALRALTRYFEVVTGSALTPGIIAAIQTFGDRINLHVHLHFLVTEGGADVAGVFHKIPRIDDSRLAEIFAREVLSMLVRKELLSPEWAERILCWRHTGFNVHGGRGPELCLGVSFRRTRPWIRTRASGEPSARPWQPCAGQDEAGGRAGGEVQDPTGVRPG
jgi:ribosomal protein S27E